MEYNVHLHEDFESESQYTELKDKEGEVAALLTDNPEEHGNAYAEVPLSHGAEEGEPVLKDGAEANRSGGDNTPATTASASPPVSDAEEDEVDGTQTSSPQQQQPKRKNNPRRLLAFGSAALKMLVPKHLAGGLIGQNGSHIVEVQESSGARVHLSDVDSMFPGTGDRVALVTGEPDQCKAATTLLVAKLHQTLSARPNRQPTDRLNLRLLVPSAARGLLIGRGGATIKEMSEISSTHIQLQPKELSPIPSEQVLNVSGKLQAVFAGINLIIDKLSEGPNVGKYTILSVNYRTRNTETSPYSAQMGQGVGMQPVGADSAPLPPAALGMGSQLMMDHGLSKHPIAAGIASAPARTTIEVQIPDNVIGIIVGKRGATVTELQRLSGAKIVVSSRDELVPGTQNRKITITGNPVEAQTAQYLISKKIENSVDGYGGPKRSQG